MKREQLEALAEFCKFNLTENEFIQADKQFTEIINMLSELDSTAAPEVDLFDKTVKIEQLRDDIPKQGLLIEEVLKDAPKSRGRYFVVPQVLE